MTATLFSSLRAAIFTRLKGDSTLMTRLGAGGIHETPPRGAVTPLIYLQEGESRPLLVAAEEGLLTTLKLVILSRSPSSDEALGLAERVEDLLQAPGLSIDGHHLVGLQLQVTRLSWSKDRRTCQVDIDLRLVTEPDVASA